VKYKYQLQKADYVNLYPLFSPAEIKEEFGDRSSTTRNIQKIYKNLGLVPQRDCLRDLVAKSYVLADTEVSEKVWRGYVWEQIAKERIARKKEVWKRISRFEDRV
jgi:hypothetical protein